MPTQLKSYYKNFILLFTGNSISQLVPFLLAPFIGRIFSPDELAVQENFLAITSLIAIVAAGRYEMAFVLAKEQKKANNLFVLTILIMLGVTILSFPVSLFSNEISKLYNDVELGKYIICLAPAVLLLALNNILIQWMIRSEIFLMVSVNRITQTITQNSGYIIFGYFGWGIVGLIAAWLLGNFFSVLLLVFPASKTLTKSDISTEEIKLAAKEYKDFPMINSLHAFTDIFAGQFLLFFLITRNYGMATLGLFAIMNRYLRAPLGIVGSAVGQLYYREASEARNQQQSVIPVFNKSVKIITLVTIPVMIVIFFWGPDLFAIYLGEKWRNAGEYARIMSPAILLNFIVSPVSATPLVYRKQKMAYLLSIGGYVISLGLLFFGTILNFNFEKTLCMYSVALSVYYSVLFFWYRSLVNDALFFLKKTEL